MAMSWTMSVGIFMWISAILFLWALGIRGTHRNKTVIAPQIQDIVREIQSKSWKTLKRRFSFFVRVILSEPVLSKGIEVVHTALGPLISSGEPQIISGWWLITVKVPVQFEEAEYGMVLLMTPFGRLLGLRFTSLSELGLGPGWQPPTYVDQYSREATAILGKGEFKVDSTLCLPSARGERTENNKFACVVFLAGSGPCDRDSTVGENKPLKDLALGLARQGIASIRFDKVTRTHTAKLRKRKNITLTDEYVEYAADAIRLAKNHANIDPDRVFVLGHSLGAVVAPLIAATDDTLAGCIIMAGPGQPIYRCFIRQLRYFISLDGPDVPLLRRQLDDAKQKADMADSPDLNARTPAKKLPFGLGPLYWLDYRKFRPIETLRTMKKPVLILQGDRDYQVTVEDDYSQWKTMSRDNPKVTCHIYEGLNHLFIRGTRPSTPLENTIPGNVDEQVIKDITSWVFETCYAYLWNDSWYA